MTGGDKKYNPPRGLELPIKAKLSFERTFHLSVVNGIFTAISSVHCQAQDIAERYGIAVVLLSRWVKLF